MRVIKERIPLLLSGRIISQTVDCIGEGYSIIEQYSRRYMKTRAEIEREIRERHERLAGARDKEPPPMDAPTSQEPMPVERLKDILSMRLSRSQIVPEDELPPTHS